MELLLVQVLHVVSIVTVICVCALLLRPSRRAELRVAHGVAACTFVENVVLSRRTSRTRRRRGALAGLRSCLRRRRRRSALLAGLRLPRLRPRLCR